MNVFQGRRHCYISSGPVLSSNRQRSGGWQHSVVTGLTYFSNCVLQDAAAKFARVLPEPASVNDDVKSEPQTTDHAVSVDAEDTSKASAEATAPSQASDSQTVTRTEASSHRTIDDSLAADTERLSSTCSVSSPSAVIDNDPTDVDGNADAADTLYDGGTSRTVHADEVSSHIGAVAAAEAERMDAASAVASCDAGNVPSLVEVVAASELEGSDVGTVMTACCDADVSSHDNMSSHNETVTVSEVAAASGDAEFISPADVPCSEGTVVIKLGLGLVLGL